MKANTFAEVLVYTHIYLFSHSRALVMGGVLVHTRTKLRTFTVSM